MPKVWIATLEELVKSAPADDYLLDEGGGEWNIAYIRSPEGHAIGWHDYLTLQFKLEWGEFEAPTPPPTSACTPAICCC